MLFFYRIFIISYYALIFVLSNQEIIQNPIISQKEFNPINYILVLQNKNVNTISSITLEVKNDFVELFHESYFFAQPLFLCKDESNNSFIFVKNKYYMVNLSSEGKIEKVIKKKDLDEKIKFLGFMINYDSNESSNMNNKDIMFYGKVNNLLVFYHLYFDEYCSIRIGNNIEEISCKFLKKNIYVCVFEDNNKINITIFAILDPPLKRIHFENVVKFEGYKNAILYDTSDSFDKILCAQKKEDNYIECIAINIVLKTSISNLQDPFVINFIELKSDYNLLFSYLEDNCNFTLFNSEYLLCCGKKDYIFCDRRDMDLNLTNNFTINLQGKISNLTFENDTEYIKIIYSNKNDIESQIYEYFIFPPVCHNIQITITSYQKEKVNISNLFERKTNTNYYISLKNLPINFATFKINDKILNNINNNII